MISGVATQVRSMSSDRSVNGGRRKSFGRSMNQARLLVLLQESRSK